MASLQIPLTRRRFLSGVIGGGGALASGLVIPARLAGGAGFTTVRWGRPVVTHGVQSGDVTAGTAGAAGAAALVWARADRAARMVVDWDTSDTFPDPRRRRGPVAAPERDFAAQLELDDLPSGEHIFYRVHFEDLDDPTLAGEPVAGRLRTPSAGDDRDVTFVWGGDTAGQGWGINPDLGGMRTYETMRLTRPDFFLHSGDTIYADGPLTERVELPDGSIWRNLVTEEKSKVAETLDEFRGNYKYNLLDDNLRRFSAEVPIIAQWDDHEVVNNWYPGEVLDVDQYTVKDVDLLASRGRQAFLEYLPIRAAADDLGRVYRAIRYGPPLDVFLLDMHSYRGPNPTADEAAPQPILGAAQLAWLKEQLATSGATWKVIASDMPLGLVVPDGPDAVEAVAAGGEGLVGREHELADLLSWIKHRPVANVVWLTADVHYTAAHHYDPARARFTDFDPFWEFVSGPLHAGTFGPNQLDPTFGPEVRFQVHAERPNQPPSDGLQFFGHVRIAAGSGVMTVRLVDAAGQTLYGVDLDPVR